MPATFPLSMIAHGRSEEDVQAALGCDWLIYQDLADLEWAVAEGNETLTRFDSSCFTGQYVTGVEPGYFERLHAQRGDEVRQQRRAG